MLLTRIAAELRSFVQHLLVPLHCHIVDYVIASSALWA